MNEISMRMFRVYFLLVIGMFIGGIIGGIIQRTSVNRYKACTLENEYTTSLSVITQWRKDSIIGRIDLLNVFLITVCDVTMYYFAVMFLFAPILIGSSFEINIEMLSNLENASHPNIANFLSDIVKFLTHDFLFFRIIGYSIVISWWLFVKKVIGTCSSFSLAKWLAHNDVNYSLVLTNRIDNSVKKHKRLNKMNEGSKGSVSVGCLLNVRPSTKTFFCIRIAVLLIINILISWLFVKFFKNIDELTFFGAVVLLLLCVLFLIKMVFNFVFNWIVRRRFKLLTEVPSNSRISHSEFKQENRKLIRNLLIFALVLLLIVGALCVTYMFQELVYSVSDEGDSYVVGSGVVLRSHISIPTTHKGMPITTIDDGAFASRHTLTSIAIPHTVTSIGMSAFKNCSSLESIVIPNGVTSIGDFAFYECGNLKSVRIPDSVTSIGNAVFKDCRELKSIHFEGTVAQWNAIDIEEDWNNVPATEVTCSDGVVPLK